MPLIWYRIASEGDSPERYTLQVPFQLGPRHALTAAEGNDLEFGDHNLEIIENEGIQLFRVTGFKTHEAAEAFFERLQGALLRLIVRKKLSVRLNDAMQTVQRQEPPVAVGEQPDFREMVKKRGWTHLDGFVDPYPAVVIPEHLRILEVGVGSLSFTLGMPVTSFLEHIAEDLSLPQPEMIVADDRLALAINLYAASLWETSHRAQVVSLTTSLEALIKTEPIAEMASNQIDRLLKVFDEARDHSAEADEQQRTLVRLRSRLENLKQESISENLRRLAAAHANVIGQTAESARRSIGSAYKVRSKLVHGGYASNNDIMDAVEWLSKAVPAILESLTDQAAKHD